MTRESRIEQRHERDFGREITSNTRDGRHWTSTADAIAQPLLEAVHGLEDSHAKLATAVRHRNRPAEKTERPPNPIDEAVSALRGEQEPPVNAFGQPIPAPGPFGEESK